MLSHGHSRTPWTAGQAATAAQARARGDKATADAFEARVKAIDDAAVDTTREVIALAEERALFVPTGHHSAHTGEFRDGAGPAAALLPTFLRASRVVRRAR
jgi:hypothetical protein